MALIDNIKESLRADGTVTDNEINMLINSAKQYLVSSGVRQTVVDNLSDGRVEQLITLYCKAMYGYDDKDDFRGFPPSYQIILEQLTLEEQGVTV